MDFKMAEKCFKEYLKNYNIEDGSIALKIRHTYEVVKKSEYIAKGLKLDKENIELAKIIALLHDIGRFEQIKEFKAFDDTKIEHAEFGVKVLFVDNLIREFIKEEKYDDIIKKAIYNHNKFKIEGKLSDIELLHCKIIRDADKLDNFRVKQKDKLQDIFPKIYNAKTINYENISTKVYEDFMKHQCIKLEDRKTIIDYWVCVIAFIFDLNFNISLQYVKENNYIDILVDRIEYKNDDTKQKMEDIRKCAKEYIENRFLMENKDLKISLALAITSVCNLKCFYCKASGENLENSLGTIDFNFLKKIIISSYENGIKNYRITGGEPTAVFYLGDLINYMMTLATDITMRITTNGYKILDYIDIIEKYKDRVEVVISVDSLNKYIGDVKYDKYLSKNIINITKELLKRKIKVRYNIVVTKENINIVPDLISKSLELGVNLKLLDLIKHNEYFEKKSLKEASEFFKNSYQSIDDIKEFLRDITDRYQENFNIFVSTGIPMSGYFKGNQYIQVKDSNRGSSFSEKCIDECPYFTKCQEGMFSPFVSNNGVLSISNCKNTKLRWNLVKMNKAEIDKSFKEIIKLFANTKIYNNFGMVNKNK